MFPIRRSPWMLAAGALIVLAANAAAYVEIELGRFTDPTALVVQEIVLRQGAGGPTTKERARLTALHRKLVTRRSTFAEDLKELSTAISGAKPFLKKWGTELQPALDLGVARAAEEVHLRRTWVLDHVEILPDGGTRPTVVKRIAQADAALARAARATTAAAKVTHYRAAEKHLTAGLDKAQVGVDLRGLDRPPPRLWNGGLIGAAGGRIAFDAGELAGVEVLVDEATVPGPMRITVAAAAPNLPYPLETIGRAVTLSVVSTEDDARFTPCHVRLPWEADRLGDSTITMWSDVAVPGGLKPRFGVSGIVEIEALAEGTFAPVHDQPPPPHPAVIEERYHVVFFAQRTLGAGTGYASELTAAVDEADFVFAASDEGVAPTGSVLTGTRTGTVRRLTEAAPFHTESAAGPSAPAGVFTWSLTQNGPTYSTTSFAITFPALGGSVTGTGTFSRDRRLVVFSGRSTTTQAYAIGVRDAGPTVTSPGSAWFLAETALSADPGDAAAFGLGAAVSMARYSVDGTSSFVPEGSAERLVSDVRIPVDGAAEPVLQTTTGAPRPIVAADVQLNGRLTADGGATSGWIHAGAGVLVARRFDAATNDVSLVVGVLDTGADFDAVFDEYAVWTAVRAHGVAGTGAGGTAPFQSVAAWTTSLEGWSALSARPSDHLFRLQSAVSAVSTLTALGRTGTPRWTCTASSILVAPQPNAYFDAVFTVPPDISQRRFPAAPQSDDTDVAVSFDGEAIVFRTARGIGFGVAR